MEVSKEESQVLPITGQCESLWHFLAGLLFFGVLINLRCLMAE